MNDAYLPAATNKMPPGACCTPDQTRCWRAHVFPLLLILALIWIIYANSFNGTWIFDDEQNIVTNPRIHMKVLDWEGIKDAACGLGGKRVDRPLSYISFALNYYFGGLSPWGYHLVNVIIHSIATIFLYLFFYETLHLSILRGKYDTRAGSIALLATALWATHPILVTSVTYIVQRMTSMAGMFYIMTMFFYLQGRIAKQKLKRTTYYLLCAIFALSSMASKENVFLLPLVLLLYEFMFFEKLQTVALKIKFIVGALLATLIVLVSFLVANPLDILSGYDYRSFSLTERLLTEPRVLLDYLSLILYPMTDRFTLIYDVPISTSLLTPWSTIPAILFWIAWVSLGAFLFRRNRIVSFCMLFFIVNNMIESSIIPLEIIYEHRNYLPSITIFLLLSMAVINFYYNFSKKHIFRIAVTCIICITIAGQGYSVIKRNYLFKHPVYIWQDNVEKSPDSSRVHLNLGKTYYDMGLFEKAKNSFLKDIEISRYDRLDLQAVPFNNLGNIYLLEKKPEKAIKFYKRALAIDPSYEKSKFNLVHAYIEQKNYDEADKVAEELINRHPEEPKILSLKSLILLRQDNYSGAIKMAYKTLLFKNDEKTALKVLGESFFKLKEYRLSKIYWTSYQKIDQEDIEPLLALIQLARVMSDDLSLRKSVIDLLLLKKRIGFRNIENRIANLERNEFFVYRDGLRHNICKGLSLEIEALSRSK